VSDVERIAQTEPNFFGHEGRECGEHRTVGSHRAWCFDCAEWCYPMLDAACKGCELPSLRAALDEANAGRHLEIARFDQANRKAKRAESERDEALADVRRLKSNLTEHYMQLRHAYRNGYDRAWQDGKWSAGFDLTTEQIRGVAAQAVAQIQRVEAVADWLYGAGPNIDGYGAHAEILAALAGEGSEQLPAKPGGHDDA
jgi:hypothetical protein